MRLNYNIIFLIARDKKCDRKLFMKMTCRFNVTHPALRKG